MYIIENKFNWHIVKQEDKTVACFGSEERAKEYVEFKEGKHKNIVVPVPKDEFDPTKEICPYCGLDCTKDQREGLKLVDVAIPKSEKRLYKIKQNETVSLLQTWHYECRVLYDLEYQKTRREKGWLRRLVEWLW